MTTEAAPITITFHLDHDFNAGRNEGGFHEVVLNRVMESLIRSGMVVTFGDEDFRGKGRVRCLIAVIEDVEDGSTGA